MRLVRAQATRVDAGWYNGAVEWAANQAASKERILQDYLDVLRHEFFAEEGSFLLKLRCDFVWDREAFSRLVEAMLMCCQAYDLSKFGPDVWEGEYFKAQLPRWLADGFWYLADFVKGHSSHPNFLRVYPEAYYESAYQRLWDLAEWFFTGRSPYNPSHRFEPL